MKIAILTANLGNFDTPVNPVEQIKPEGVTQIAFHRFTDENFPPITGLTPRLQYRIPKLFGWQMYPGYDIYIWLDGSMSLQDPHSVEYLLNELGDNDIAFFKHPWRKTIKEEVDHVEEYLNKGNDYIVSRYKNGLHKEMYAEIEKDKSYTDDLLLASMACIYRNECQVHETMWSWWHMQSRYYTVDQIAQTYVAKKFSTQSLINLKVIDVNIFKNQYVSLVSKHK